MGAWAAYGLGVETNDLPGFVVVSAGMIPPGGLDCFTAGFLPAVYQGSLFADGPAPVADVAPVESEAGRQRRKLDFARRLDRRFATERGETDAVSAAIRNGELAFRMQQSVPELARLDDESQAMHRQYGLDDPNPQTRLYGRELLLARRLLERGVPFVEVLCPNVGHDRWDQHSNLRKGHADNAAATDRPIAGLLRDLKSRGMLDDTLVVWGGEFGRTPMAQGSDGRDHNPFGFSIWLAGGGVRGGFAYGATDEYGYYAVEGKCQVHDLHATMLHLLGFDHTRLTYRFGGRDMRLTDVHGKVLTECLR
jgi:arylsulfatase A-like enzyme